MGETLPQHVHRTMQALTEGLVAILGERLVGVYLGGSLSLGDFCEASSDVDFLVVTRAPLSTEEVQALEWLHRALLQSYPYASRLEGDYAPQSFLIPEGTIAPVPGCKRGVFLPNVGQIMLSADNIRNMREQGLAFYGPPPAEVLPPVTAGHVRTAVREMLMEESGQSDTPEQAAQAVLNLLRSALALETGMPASKSAGAEWGLARLAPTWHPLIRAAVAVRRGRGTEADKAILREQLGDLARLIKAALVS